MMLWHIGNNWINPAHIIRVEYIAATPEHEGEDDFGSPITVKAKPTLLIITLSEITYKAESWDYATYGEYAAHYNETITIRGLQAERLAAWLDEHAQFPTDEPMTGEAVA